MTSVSFKRVSLILSILFLLYAFILIFDSFLKKNSKTIYVEDLNLDMSPSSLRHMGSTHKSYYIETNEGGFSIDEATYNVLEIGDSLELRRTLILHLNFDLYVFGQEKKLSIYGSVFNYFPLFPILLIASFLSQLTRKEEVFYLILRPLSLIIGSIITIMSLWVNL